MSYEVIEALEEYYRDDEETLVECLLYLSNMSPNKVIELSNRIQDTLESMDRCGDCGAKLYPYTWEEHHPELDGNPIEYMSELRCPNCD